MSFEYPDTISLEGEKLAFLIKHSKLLENLYDNQGNKGPLELSADLLFPLDKDKRKKWELFYDLFFPEMKVRPLFAFVNTNTIQVRKSRGGKEAVREMLDYLMVDEPNTMMEFARQQAKQQTNVPRPFLSKVPREQGIVRFPVPANIPNEIFNNWPNNNEYNGYYNNNNSNNNNNIIIGYTEPEEEAVAKMSNTNVRKYLPPKRRSTRRNNRKSRKARRSHK